MGAEPGQIGMNVEGGDLIWTLQNPIKASGEQWGQSTKAGLRGLLESTELCTVPCGRGDGGPGGIRSKQAGQGPMHSVQSQVWPRVGIAA